MTQVLPATSRPSPAGDDRLSALLDVVGRLAEQQKLLLEAIKPAGALPTPPLSSPASPPPALSFPSKPAGFADDVRAIVAELFREQQSSAARDAYAREHLADLPDAYRRLLPATSNEGQLASAEQAIRQQFRADLKALRRSVGEPAGATLGGDEPGGRPPAAAVDYSKLSPLQQIAVGLRSAEPGRAIEAIKPGEPRKPAATSASAASALPEVDEFNPAEMFVGAD